ncbi:hypothetical protein EW145_g6688 [Phellinidium pouzarii]|uniref:Uncharacterized protein n=1 Tax=Phellinidium pouzarii TaxID=167371 RepID=A0A4V3XBQ4_9AGAM|nr:hypothetical protein EW145_g6688 [Phellinidium pouzarii]
MTTLGRRLCASATRAAGRSLQILFLRLKRANLPLLIAFASALFMFLRAVSGAGYADPYAVTAHTYNDSLAHPVPAGAWVRFKDSLFTCPDDTALNVDDDNGEDSGVQLSADAVPGTRQQTTGVTCLRERLRSVVSSHGSMLKNKAAAEDRAFAVSLDAIPPRKDAVNVDGDTAPLGSRMAEDERTDVPLRWKRRR